MGNLYDYNLLDKIIVICVSIITLGYVLNEKNLINASFLVLFIKLFIMYKNSKRYMIEYKEYKSFFGIFILMMLLCLSFCISSIASTEISNSFHEAKNFTKWMFLPFFCSCFILYKSIDLEKYILSGMVAGNLLIISNLFYNYFFLHINRPGSLWFEHPNSTAGTLIFIFPFIITSGYFSVYSKFVFLILEIVALFITGSRGAILAFLAIIGVSALLYKSYISKRLKENTFKSITIVLSIIIIGLSVAFCSNSKTYNRFYEIIKYHNSMAKNYVGGDRILLWESSMDMIKDYPLGIGLKNFNKVYNDGNYISPYAREKWLESPHNIFLHICVETGLLGLILFAYLIVYQIKWLYIHRENDLARAYFLSIIGMCVHGLVDYIFFVRSYYQLYWFICGVTWINYIEQQLSNKK